jgi:DNA-binding NarL/FixJ family response regulator
MNDRIRVAIVDDSSMFRRALHVSLSRRPEVEVVGLAGNSDEGMYLIEKAVPDVALVDLRMPEVDGKEFTRRLKRRYPGVEAVALTVSDSEEDLLDMLRAGARGYVLKTASPGEIVQAILAATRGESWLSPKMASQLIAEFTRLPAVQLQQGLKEDVRLTPREQSILRHLALGKTNREIGTSLGIAETTVKTHLKNILEKLHVRSRLEAALLALQVGLEDERKGSMRK